MHFHLGIFTYVMRVSYSSLVFFFPCSWVFPPPPPRIYNSYGILFIASIFLFKSTVLEVAASLGK